MHSTERHVSKQSEYVVHTCSETAKNLFFYPVCAGQFWYEPGYLLSRSRYDSFLLMAVTAGSCEVRTDSFQLRMHPGDVVLIDCYAPHAYQTDEGWQACWLHFDGPQSRGYYDYLTAERGNLFHPADFSFYTERLQTLYLQLKNRTHESEPALSLAITELLTRLAAEERRPAEDAPLSRQALSQTISYLQKHFAEPISLRTLASMASLSPYYFTRLFTKETGQTPHQYLLTVRINTARFLLKSSALSIKEIGFTCGFTSESSFSAAFRKKTGQTPGEYRRFG